MRWVRVLDSSISLMSSGVRRPRPVQFADHAVEVAAAFSRHGQVFALFDEIEAGDVFDRFGSLSLPWVAP